MSTPTELKAMPGSEQEAKGNVENFAKELLVKLMEKKAIDADIKQLKQDYKEEGVPVGVVSRIIQSIKADMKRSDTEIFEMDTIKEWLQTNATIEDNIGKLL